MVTGQGTNRYFEIQLSLNRTDESLYLDGFWTILNEIRKFLIHMAHTKWNSSLCQEQRKTQESNISTQSFYKSRQIAGNTRYHRNLSSD